MSTTEIAIIISTLLTYTIIITLLYLLKRHELTYTTHLQQSETREAQYYRRRMKEEQNKAEEYHEKYNQLLSNFQRYIKEYQQPHQCQCQTDTQDTSKELCGSGCDCKH